MSRYSRDLVRLGVETTRKETALLIVDAIIGGLVILAFSILLIGVWFLFF